MVIVALLCVNASIGAQQQQHSLQKLYRREVQPVKDEKSEPIETSTVSSAPSVRPIIIGESGRECTRFNHTYCSSQFGYQYGLFPNHKGQSAKETAAEFNHFARLFDSGCSDKIGVFLCFTYFPLCTPNTDSSSQLQEVLPCKETCEEVHKSECTEYVSNATDGWAEHLSCDQAIFKPKASKQCATGNNEDESCPSKSN